jgi:hypothetical protein
VHVPDNFDSCYVALLALMWDDLEAALQRPASTAMDCPIVGEHADLRFQILRIELSLLASCTDKLHGAGWMSSEQSTTLRRLIGELRALLDFSPADAPLQSIAAIARAQDRLFDEVLEVVQRQAPEERRLAG